MSCNNRYYSIKVNDLTEITENLPMFKIIVTKLALTYFESTQNI